MVSTRIGLPQIEPEDIEKQVTGVSARKRWSDIEGQLKALQKGQTLVLAADEARLAGFTGIPSDWFVKAYGGGEGLENTYAFVSPENWEYSGLKFGEGGKLQNYQVKSPEGKSFFMKELELLQQQAITQTVPPELSIAERRQLDIRFQELLKQSYMTTDLEERGKISEELSAIEKQLRPPQQAITQPIPQPVKPVIAPPGIPGEITPGEHDVLVKQYQQDPMMFYQSIIDKGRSRETENLLRDFLPNISDVEINRLFTEAVMPLTTDLVHKVFPYITNDQFEEMFTERPDEFWNKIAEGGRTSDKDNLLRSMGLGWDDIDLLFPPEIEPPKAIPWGQARQAMLYEELGYQPAPPVKDFKERQERALAFRAYRKAGGKMFADQWELHGMPATPAVELPMLSREERQAVIDMEVQKRKNLAAVFGKSLTYLPKQLGASILQATQGQGGASVVNKDWADKFIEDAKTNLGKFTEEVTDKYGESDFPIKMSDVATLPQNIAYSLTSMGVGLAVGIPVGLAPVPGARVAAWGLGTVASGAVAYSMTTYQVMQQYLEAKNIEMIRKTGRGLTAEEEQILKDGFQTKAMQYGLWEAIPEAISNLAFGKILTAPLTKVAGKSIATTIVKKLTGMYGEEFLTETITQKGQTDIEVEAGLREGKISWIEAFKEVAPQTFLLTTILGGAGQVGISSVQKIKQSLKGEAGDSAVFKDINENITDNVFNEIETEAQTWWERIVEQARIAPERGAITPEGFMPKKPEVTPVTPDVTYTVKKDYEKITRDYSLLVPTNALFRAFGNRPFTLEEAQGVLEKMEAGITPEIAKRGMNLLSGITVTKNVVTLPTAEAVTPTAPVTLKVTEASWNAMPAYKQAEMAKSVGLTPRAGTIYWKELMPSERDALSGVKIPEVALPTAEAVAPTAPVITEVTKELWGTRWTEAEVLPIDETLPKQLRDLIPRMKYDAGIGVHKYEATLPQPYRAKAIKDWLSTRVISPVLKDATISMLPDGKEYLIKRSYGNIRVRIEGNNIKITADTHQAHYEAVRQAISEGKPVPSEVLKDYPDLAKLKPVTPTAPAKPEVTEGKYVRLGLEKWRAKGEEIGLAYEEREIARLKDEYRKLVAIPKAEQVTPTAPAVEIPEAEEGMPEAGYQPAMIEGVTEREVRPAGKGKVTQISMDEQLKLEQARRAAEEAPEEVREAYEAQAQIEGIKAIHETDPVAQKRIWIGKSKKGVNLYRSLDWFISLKEQNFPEYFTVKQAQLLAPFHDWSRYTQKDTKQYNKVPRDAVLDDMATELGFTGIDASEQLARRVEQIAKEKRQLKEYEATIKSQMAEAPVTLEKETEDVSDLIKVRGEPLYTIQQIDALSAVMGEYLINPNTVNAYQVVRQYQSLERARRFKNVAARRQDLIVTEGLSWEDAHKNAMDEFARGKLPSLTIEGLEDITADLRDVFFAKVHHTFDQLGSRYEGERWATVTALANALAGNPIPMDKGKGSLLFPEGGSAWDRLNYVFGKQPRLMEGLTKTAEQKKSLKDVTEGIFREVPEGGMPPIPIDQEMAEYLRNLSLTYDQIKLWEQPQELQFEIIEDLKNLPSDLKVQDTRTAVQKIIEMRRKRLLPTPPVTRYEAPIDDAFKQGEMWTSGEKQMVVRVLKELGWLPIDIGNFLRANKASFDQSFLRQGKVIASGHPVIGYQMHTTAWQSMFSQKHAEAEWQLITRDPRFEMYERLRLDRGADPLRVPAFANEKGTAQYRRAEEYGFPTVERTIPRLTQKLPHIKYSERAFSAGLNKGVWLLWNQKYDSLMREAEKVASGEVTLPEGEAVDIVKEMGDFQEFLAQAVQRATLPGKQELAPFYSAFFFAARSKLGRFLFPMHLLGMVRRGRRVAFNPRIAKEAWRDWLSMTAYICGVEFLGAWLGLWDLEDDPRNAEFMSIRIGKIRIDPWAGYRQFVVLYARLVTKTGVSSTTGAEYEANPIGTMHTFFGYSLSPFMSTLLEFWTGRNFLGQVIDFAEKKYWIEKVTPFSINDVWDAAEHEGWRGSAIAIVPAIYGEGVQTYTGDWEDNWQKGGLPKFFENTAYGVYEPYYDAKDWWTDTAHQFKGVDPASLTAKKGYPPQIRAIAEALLLKEHLDTLPDEKLISINSNPAEGLTIKDYMELWRQRQKLVDLGDKAQFTRKELQPDGTYKEVTYKGDDAVSKFDDHDHNIRGFIVKGSRARLGNISQSQYALLMEYWTIEGKQKQKAFVQEHEAEIGVVATNEYLRAHPKENAQLAIWGQAGVAGVVTKEAYNLAKQMVKDLDMAYNFYKDYLPPEHVADTHFTRIEKGDEYGYSSNQVSLIVLEDYYKAHPTGEVKEGEPQSWIEWQNLTERKEPLQLPDKPLDYYKLQVDNAKLFDKLNDTDYLKTLDDKKKGKDGLTDRERYVAGIRATKVGDVTFRDIEVKVEAIGKGTRETPILDEIVNSFVEHRKITDQYGGSSAEAKLNRYDNSALNDFLINPDYWTKPAEALYGDRDQQYLDDYLMPQWRVSVKYREQNDTYNNQIPKKYGDMTDEQVNALPVPEGINPDYWARIPAHKKRAYMIQQERDTMMAENEGYRKDGRKAEALQKEVPLNLVDTYVGFYELPEKGQRRKRMLVNPDGTPTEFGQQVWHDIMGKDIPKLEDIHNVGWDETYEANQKAFDKFWALGDIDSIFYIEDEDDREAERNRMRYDAEGNPTDFRLSELRLNAYEARNKITGERIPENQIDNYVGYNVLAEKGKRRDRFLMENKEYYDTVWLGVLQNSPINFSKVPDEEYDNIYDQFKAQFDEWDSYGDERDKVNFIQDEKERAKKREQLDLVNPAFKEARIRQDAYMNLIGAEKYVDDYVGYYQLIDKGKPAWWTDEVEWYEDDWYIIEHRGWWKAYTTRMRQNPKTPNWGKGMEDFDKVPTREVFNLYMVWKQITNTEAKYQFRLSHPDLDMFLVREGFAKKRATGTSSGVKKSIITEAQGIVQKRIEMAERLQAEADEAERSLAEIERRLRGR